MKKLTFTFLVLLILIDCFGRVRVVEHRENKIFNLTNLNTEPMKHFEQFSENNRQEIDYSTKVSFNPNFVNIFKNGEKLESIYIRRERATWETKHKYSFTLTDRRTHEAVGSPYKTAQQALKYYIQRFLA